MVKHKCKCDLLFSCTIITRLCNKIYIRVCIAERLVCYKRLRWHWMFEAMQRVRASFGWNLFVEPKERRWHYSVPDDLIRFLRIISKFQSAKIKILNQWNYRLESLSLALSSQIAWRCKLIELDFNLSIATWVHVNSKQEEIVRKTKIQHIFILFKLLCYGNFADSVALAVLFSLSLPHFANTDPATTQIETVLHANYLCLPTCHSG